MLEAKPRGRPRTFDEDRVLGSILDTFWTKGFTACSMDELAEAARVSKPALYAAFGDKRAMYLRAMERFTGEFEGAVEAALGPERPLADGLLAFYRAELGAVPVGRPRSPGLPRALHGGDGGGGRARDQGRARGRPVQARLCA